MRRVKNYEWHLPNAIYIQLHLLFLVPINGFYAIVPEKTLERPLDYKEIKPLNPKGNQSWISIRRTDAEAETPILWPPDVKNQLIRKDPDVGKDWRQEEKWTTEDEIIGWHHQLNGLEFEPAPETVKDSEAWRDAFHGVAKSRTWLSNWTTTMVTHQKGIQLWFFVGLIATLRVYSTYHPQILCNNSFIGREMKS